LRKQMAKHQQDLVVEVPQETMNSHRQVRNNPEIQ